MSLMAASKVQQYGRRSFNGGGCGGGCYKAKGYKAWIFYGVLYLVAVGSGCLTPHIISHGAYQFDDGKQSSKKKLSTFFKCAYFAFCSGEKFRRLLWLSA